MGLGKIISHYACSQSVVRFVCPGNDLIVVVEFHDALNRPEYLILSYQVLVLDIGEHCRFDVPSPISPAASISHQFRTLLPLLHIF